MTPTRPTAAAVPAPAETPLDAAFLAQDADPDPALRLRFHERVLDAELAVPLAAGAEEPLAPQVFDLEDGRFVLAFNRDERLADFFGAPVEFAVLTGRRLVAALAGQGTGVGLNLGAPSATLLPPEAIDWLAAMAAREPEAREARLATFAAPAVPRPLADALAAKLATMADAVPAAHLVASGADTLLVLTGVTGGAQTGVAAAIAEAVRFTADGPAIDVAFAETGSAMAEAAARAGLRLALPEAKRREPAGPGMDPARPPRLRF